MVPQGTFHGNALGNSLKNRLDIFEGSFTYRPARYESRSREVYRPMVLVLRWKPRAWRLARCLPATEGVHGAGLKTPGLGYSHSI